MRLDVRSGAVLAGGSAVARAVGGASGVSARAVGGADRARAGRDERAGAAGWVGVAVGNEALCAGATRTVLSVGGALSTSAASIRGGGPAGGGSSVSMAPPEGAGAADTGVPKSTIGGADRVVAVSGWAESRTTSGTRCLVRLGFGSAVCDAIEPSSAASSCGERIGFSLAGRLRSPDMAAS
jgi:hypothetical protein